MTARTTRYLIIGAVVVLAAVFAFFRFSGGDDPADAGGPTSPAPTSQAPSATQQPAGPPVVAKGECAKVTKSPQAIAKSDCADPASVFSVAAAVDGPPDKCPGGHYTPYPPQGTYVAGWTYCLMLNAKVGDCFTDIPKAVDARRVECSAAEFQVLSIRDGITDPYRCEDVPDTTGGFVYQDPPRLLCGKRNIP